MKDKRQKILAIKRAKSEGRLSRAAIADALGMTRRQLTAFVLNNNLEHMCPTRVIDDWLWTRCVKQGADNDKEVAFKSKVSESAIFKFRLDNNLKYPHDLIPLICGKWHDYHPKFGWKHPPARDMNSSFAQ